MKQVTLTEAQWQVVMQALLNVHAPMAETGPVYNAMVQQLAPAAAPAGQAQGG